MREVPADSLPAAGTDDVASPNRGRHERPRRRQLLFVGLLIALILGTGAAWVLASSLGGGPDDDYHMGSIWCPRPVAESCQVDVVDGKTQVLVPQPVALSSLCHRFKAEESADCAVAMDNNKTAYTYRFDNGLYPRLYYRVQHALTVESVPTAVLSMRTLNVLIATVVLGTIGALLRREHRAAYALSMLGAWVPMGIYFIASINPSAWSIVGVLAYAAGLFGSLTTEGRRRWVLLGLSVVGIIMTVGSRFDSPFYIFVISLALVFAIPMSRRAIPQWTLALAPSVLAVIVSVLRWGGNITAVLQNKTDDSALYSPRLLVETLIDLPRYLAGMVGRDYGPGWFDVPVPTSVQLLAVVASFSVVFAGLRGGTWRKWLSSATIAGGLGGIPTAVVVVGLYPFLGHYQPRYILPLYAVLIFFMLAQQKEAPFSRIQLGVYGALIVFIHGYFLHSVLWRYVTGSAGERPFNLNSTIEWWWDIPVSPMAVWVIGVACFAGVVGMTLWWIVNRQEPALVGRGNDAADSASEGEVN
ncbi:MAG: DUF2142 domain-containing protein [Trueperella sp.]|uniref:DUF2142 domain-containing protein n=1 Tax=Trueperella sp. TaxID=2699835 RepID=UPI0025E86F09|nr:DUF2142 domain-containing protein [Trueperella sp.]MCI7306549.1 DUF2142 domain-containing protein [Trueperella sp.]